VSEIIFQPRAKKTWLHSLTTSALVALAVSLFGAVGVVRAVNADLDTVKREEVATTALSPADAEFENYLFVGSDSRVGADPSDADYGNVGDAGDIGGQRSDTLMVLHYVKRAGTVSLMSIPRDLWVAIGNGENEQRINTAYQEGTDVLVRTVQRALNIPIHHYVEIDFQGFKRIVEAVGGVNVCVEYPSRDKHTGLFMKAGCSTLDGVEGLAYARSRFFEQKVDGDWELDGTSDIGRSTRQRGFVQALAKSAVLGVSGNPFKAGDVLKGGLSAVVVDTNLDLIEFAKKLRPAAGGNIASFPLDVYGDMVGSNSVLKLGKGADELIAFFNGTGPRPQLNP
jgi:LCP family protein required for cell wall assembly